MQEGRRDTFNIREDSSRRDNSISWMSTAAGVRKSAKRKVSNIRDDSIIQEGHQQQQQELKTRTLATAEGRPATARMPEIVEMPTTVLASAETPLAQISIGLIAIGLSEFQCCQSEGS
jgi:hypothetical protein